MEISFEYFYIKIRIQILCFLRIKEQNSAKWLIYRKELMTLSIRTVRAKWTKNRKRIFANMIFYQRRKYGMNADSVIEILDQSMGGQFTKGDSTKKN